VKLGEFLRDKLIFIVINLVTAGFSVTLLYAVRADLYFTLFVPSVFLIGCMAMLTVEYFSKRRYYKRLKDTLRELDEKRFLLEVIERPDSSEGQIWYGALKSATKAMNDAVARSELNSKEYREYIELWVHEIKTPLAGLKLALENSRNKALLLEADKVEGLVEQALFYARSGDVEADYSVRQVTLSKLVNTALKSDARYLIQQKVSVDLGDLSFRVLADSKWLVFVLRQVIENAVKYGGRKLEFTARAKGDRVVLEIRDDGVGIPPEDVERVFDKGFTGVNGRRFGRSTGLGLYLCQKLCQKLGVKLSLSSTVGQGTTVEMVFPTK
jgi:signal transduction histidine kinase